MYPAGSYAGIVKGDAVVAYTNAAMQPSTTTLSNQDLTGMTLLPGVYKFDAAAALSAGQLFFDANGDPDAVWIIQIGTSLNIAANTGMFFTSGVGNPNNVVWAVGTTVDLHTNSAFIGNILAGTVIALRSKASVNGRLVSLNGAVTLIDNSVSFPSMAPTGAPSVSLAPTVSPAPTTVSVSNSEGGDGDSSDTNVGLIVGLSVGGAVLLGAVALVAMNKAGGGAEVPQKDQDDNNQKI